MTNIDRELLIKLSENYNPASLRQLALCYLKGIGGAKDSRKGQAKLLCAARMADRQASWLLTVYYYYGVYSFDQSSEKSHYWRHRTEQRLSSDASLSYSDIKLQVDAERQYYLWIKTLALIDSGNAFAKVVSLYSDVIGQ